MALSSPSGCLSDEEKETAVFESTAAEHGGLAKPCLPEVSVISPGLNNRQAVTEPKQAVKPGGGEGHPERVKVYVRIRPLSEVERQRGEEQACLAVQDDETLLLKAPKESQNMRMAEKGITQSIHQFSFSKIFGPETTQQQLYECTLKDIVKDVLKGENRLLYTYGVTNSGKTYTIQGKGREAGLLPRALVSLFGKVQGRMYDAMDLKPVMYQDVKELKPSEVRAEEIRRNSLLEEDDMTCRRGGTTTIWDSGLGGLSSLSNVTSQLEETDSLDLRGLSHSCGSDLEEEMQFSIWVSYYEIYNEFLYDLLDASPSRLLKRATLRLSEDKMGNAYIKELTWIQVRTAEEAWKILRAGHRNQSFASTHHNQNSSRSHSMFCIRVLHVPPQAASSQVTHTSELIVCDLAGSERSKNRLNDERMREATNINTSLLTLGRCIAALRHNQNNKSRPPQVVPFRDSKLTRVLQGFFCGRGTSSMVVNISPCASVYDETLHALKFSSIATQLVHGPSTMSRVAYILSLLREPTQEGNESSVLEEEDESDDEDTSLLNTEAMLHAISVLIKEVQRQREEKEAIEANVREQVVSEMMEVITNMQNGFSETLEAQKALLEQRCEDRINILQTAWKKYYRNELMERDQEIEELSAALEGAQSAPASQPKADTETCRRSKRITNQREQARLRAEEQDQCLKEVVKTQGVAKLKAQVYVPGSPGTATGAVARKLEEGQRNLRQLRLDLQKLGANLQSGERACCRNTGGERLRQALTAADETLSKQDQILVELQNSLTLVKADLRRKAETLAQTEALRLQLPPSGLAASTTTPGSHKKRCYAAAATSNAENQPPLKLPAKKRLVFQSLLRKHNTCNRANVTPNSQIFQSHH